MCIADWTKTSRDAANLSGLWGQELMLVLEDDMEILRWPTAALLATAPVDWQILQLYSLGPRATHLYSLERAVPLWERWTLHSHLFNTGAYIINRSGMRQVR